MKKILIFLCCFMLSLPTLAQSQNWIVSPSQQNFSNINPAWDNTRAPRWEANLGVRNQMLGAQRLFSSTSFNSYYRLVDANNRHNLQAFTIGVAYQDIAPKLGNAIKRQDLQASISTILQLGGKYNGLAKLPTYLSVALGIEQKTFRYDVSKTGYYDDQIAFGAPMPKTNEPSANELLGGVNSLKLALALWGYQGKKVDFSCGGVWQHILDVNETTTNGMKGMDEDYFAIHGSLRIYTHSRNRMGGGENPKNHLLKAKNEQKNYWATTLVAYQEPHIWNLQPRLSHHKVLGKEAKNSPQGTSESEQSLDVGVSTQILLAKQDYSRQGIVNPALFCSYTRQQGMVALRFSACLYFNRQGGGWEFPNISASNGLFRQENLRLDAPF